MSVRIEVGPGHEWAAGRPDEPPVQVAVDGQERYFAKRWMAHVYGEPLAARVELRFVTDADTGPRCVRVTFMPEEGRNLASDTSMPTQTQCRAYMQAAIALAMSTNPPEDGQVIGRPPEGEAPITEERFEENYDLAFELTKPRRRSSITDDLLREVAALYRHAVDEGLAPRPYIAGELHKSPSTVATYIGLARKRIDPNTGQTFLGPAIGRRPGEATEGDAE